MRARKVTIVARSGAKREPERIPLTGEMQAMLLGWGSGDRWAEIGAAVGQWLEEAQVAHKRSGKKTPLDKEKFYDDCGVFLSKSGNTVRQYMGLARDTADVRDEFPQFGGAHWMLFRAQAKREGREIGVVAGEWAATECEFAGRPVPVKVVKARNAAKGAAQVVDVGALIDQAARVVQKALDHSDDAELSGWLDRARDALTSAAGIAETQERDGDVGRR